MRAESPVPPWPPAVEVVHADLRSPEALSPALEGADAVLHLAAATSGDEDGQFASTVVGSENLTQAMARAGTKRMVLASSLDVYDWAKARQRLDENSPLVGDAYSMDAYTLAKVWQERVVARAAAQHGWELTVLRPGFIWGPERQAVAGMGRYVGPFLLMFGPLSRLPLTYVENCADCFVAALERPAALGQAFNVVDSDGIRVWRFAVAVAKEGKRSTVLVPVPYVVGLGLAHAARTTNRLLNGHRARLPGLLTPHLYEAQFKPLRFSNQKLRDVLGWTPPLPFRDCLARTFAPR